MKTATTLFLLIIVIIFESEALDCGIQRNNDELRQAVVTCLKTNKTLEELWNVSSEESASDSATDSSSTEDQNVHYNTTPPRNKRQTVPANEHESNTSSNSTANNLNDAINDSCLANCIFNNLGLTNGNGFPEHDKIVDSLLKTATERELRDFLQDTVDECFQEIDKEKTSRDVCIYSSKLVTCIAERGRINCEDWPVGNLPF